MKADAPSPYRFAFAGLVAMAAAMGIGRFVYTPILPGMVEELGLTASQAGLIASANYLGYLLGALAAAGGWAAGRERALMLAGLGASTALAFAMAATDSFVLFLTIRLLAGVASAFVMVFLAAIVFSHLAGAGRSDLQAVHFAGVGVGIALSSAMMATLVSLHAAWTAGWLGAGAISLAGFAVVFAMIDRGPLVQGAARAEPPLPKSPALARIILAYGLFGFGYVITATFLIAIVRQNEAGRLFEAMVWLVTGLAGIFSVYLWNRVATATTLRFAYVAACLVEALGVAASVTLGGSAGPLIAAALLGGTFVALTALGLQAARLLAPDAPRRSFALMTAAFGVGQIIGPVVAGYMAQWTGSFFLPSLAASAILVVSAALVWSAAPKSP